MKTREEFWLGIVVCSGNSNQVSTCQCHFGLFRKQKSRKVRIRKREGTVKLRKGKKRQRSKNAKELEGLGKKGS